MAERRMLRKSITSSDQFQNLPLDHQALYFHLCLNADDDGFLSNAKSITRMLGLPLDALTAMADAGYLILFESGVVVIRHWRVHNTIRKDRYVPTLHQREFERLVLDKEDTYQLRGELQISMETTGCQAGNQSVPQVSIEEYRSVQDKREYRAPAPEDSAASSSQNESSNHEQESFSIESASERSAPACNPDPPTREAVRTYAHQNNSKADPDRFYDYYSARNWMLGRSPITNWQSAFRVWENREKDFCSSSPAGKAKLLPIQQYSQRDYSGQEESMEDVLNRLMAG